MVNGWVEACANGQVGCMGGLYGWCRYGGMGGFIDGWVGWIGRSREELVFFIMYELRSK